MRKRAGGKQVETCPAVQLKLIFNKRKRLLLENVFQLETSEWHAGSIEWCLRSPYRRRSAAQCYSSPMRGTPETR